MGQKLKIVFYADTMQKMTIDRTLTSQYFVNFSNKGMIQTTQLNVNTLGRTVKHIVNICRNIKDLKLTYDLIL